MLVFVHSFADSHPIFLTEKMEWTDFFRNLGDSLIIDDTHVLYTERDKHPEKVFGFMCWLSRIVPTTYVFEIMSYFEDLEKSLTELLDNDPTVIRETYRTPYLWMCSCGLWERIRARRDEKDESPKEGGQGCVFVTGCSDVGKTTALKKLFPNVKSLDPVQNMETLMEKGLIHHTDPLCTSVHLSLIHAAVKFGWGGIYDRSLLDSFIYQEVGILLDCDSFYYGDSLYGTHIFGCKELQWKHMIDAVAYNRLKAVAVLAKTIFGHSRWIIVNHAESVISTHFLMRMFARDEVYLRFLEGRDPYRYIMAQRALFGNLSKIMKSMDLDVHYLALKCEKLNADSFRLLEDYLSAMIRGKPQLYGVRSPKYVTDAGYDFNLIENEEIVDKLVLKPFEVKKFNSTLNVIIPPGMFGEICVRSHMGMYLNCHRGIIDSGYAGDVKVLIQNRFADTLSIDVDHPVSIVLHKKVPATNSSDVMRLQDFADFGEFDRGLNGFGSTNVQ